jgi:hypothetical protein
MIDKVTEIEDENLTNEVIAEHLSILSKGKLRLSGDEITVTADASSQFTPKKNYSNSSNNRNNFNRKNNKNNFSKNKRQRRF